MNIRTRGDWKLTSRITISDLIELLAHLAGCQQSKMAEILSAVIASDQDAPHFMLIKKTHDDEVITEWRYTMEPARMASALAAAAPNHDWNSRESRGALLEKVEKRRDQTKLEKLTEKRSEIEQDESLSRPEKEVQLEKLDEDIEALCPIRYDAPIDDYPPDWSV